MIEWLQKRPLTVRVLVYAVAAILAFAVAAGVGATVALIVRGDLAFPAREEPNAAGERGDAPQGQGVDAHQSQQEEAGAEQEKDSSQQGDETAYVGRVGEIQTNSVETFLESHNRLLRYDSLTADDIDEMQANQATLQEMTEQIADLEPPPKYKEQYRVFRTAISELHEAAQLAHALAADPTAATQSSFDEYDQRVNEASAHLQRSNEILNRDYKTTEGVQRVSAL